MITVTHKRTINWVNRFDFWSQEELDLLKSDLKLRQLAKHPLLVSNGRTYKSIESRRRRLLLEIQTTPAQPKEERETLAECSRACMRAGVCDLSCEQKAK